MYNPSGLYMVAVKNDTGIVVGYVPRTIISGLLSISAYRRHNCVRTHRYSRRASVDLPLIAGRTAPLLAEEIGTMVCL